MKKLMIIWCTLVTLFSVNLGSVSADAIVDWYPEESSTNYYSTENYYTENYYTDYYVQVAAPDGGVNFRYGPGVEYNKIFSNMIPNGFVLHMEGSLLSYEFLTKLLAISCVVLIIVVTALILLLKRK